MQRNGSTHRNSVLEYCLLTSLFMVWLGLQSSYAQNPTATPILPRSVILTETPTEIPTATVTPIPTSKYDDLVVSQGFGGETLVNVRYFNEANAAYSSIRRSFSGIPPSFEQQIGGGEDRATYLASGDLDGDGIQDIVTSFGPITETNTDTPNLVMVRNSLTKKIIGHFFVVFPTGFLYPMQYNIGDIRATVGQFIGSNPLQVAVAQGFGGYGLIRIYQFNNDPANNYWKAVSQIKGLPDDRISQNGIKIGMNLASGDLDQDGLDELIVGQTNGPTSKTIFHVLKIDQLGRITKRLTFYGFIPRFRGNGGIEIQVADLNGDRYPEIIVGSMGNSRDFKDIRDSVPLNLVGIISPVIENEQLAGFTYPLGKSVFNAFSEEVNPSGAVTLAAGEFDGNSENGKELAIGTSARIEVSEEGIAYRSPAPEPRYKLLKVHFDGTTISKIQTLGPSKGYLAFVGNSVPTSKTIYLSGIKSYLGLMEN